ncbi:hypothetical protein JHJ32_01490 [Parapedobacter sp. ISTM3]|uniref:Glycosyltransferase family 10 (Fucosyltransferase) C-term n=1 Tax=Parapedobacter luteus TaxID=623280 RepID=A0A1T4ZU78_9SPHI|nr:MULTISPECIES: glycosyltransferase family 10 [Parapedobacter]MBK1438649.1 hypothetical protein [Parapedobacter sp. ISTM3]SKB26290.1 Glycosyltransferase family 10 (fucosyltransferase) C-term [Parapedobacter luteus]
MHIKRFFQKLGWYRQPAFYQYQPDENHIELLNFWTSQKRDEIWLYQFVRQHFSQYLTTERTLLLSSVFGPRKLITDSHSSIKVFYTGENVRRFHEYRDHCLPDVDLSLGFDDIRHPNYIRFPIWIFYFFGGGQTQRAIQRTLDQFVLPKPISIDARQFCSMVCSHDKNGIRGRLFKALSTVAPIASAGTYLTNTDILQTQYNDDKTHFLQAFQFNICPENTNHPGYVTEKIFQAIQADTVPIYWGSDNNPEPEVLNPDAILFYNGRGSVGTLTQQVEDLYRNPRKYAAFLAQPKFKPTAAEYIAHRIALLRQRLQQLFEGS